LAHATSRGVDHRANPARLGVERILKCHDNSLENDSHQRFRERAPSRTYFAAGCLVARQTHSAITPTRTESSASRALMVSLAELHLATHGRAIHHGTSRRSRDPTLRQSLTERRPQPAAARTSPVRWRAAARPESRPEVPPNQSDRSRWRKHSIWERCGYTRALDPSDSSVALDGARRGRASPMTS